MKLEEEVIARLKKLKNPDVDELLAFYTFATQSDSYDDYVALLVQKNMWRDELKESPTSIRAISDEKLIDKSFDNAIKFMKERKGIEETIIMLRSNLTQAEQMEAEVAATSLLDEARIKMRKRVKN